MKKVLFPATNRVHLARQQLLLKELNKNFNVDAQEFKDIGGGIDNVTVGVANHFKQVIADNKYDLALIRGDRFEMLPIAMLCAYKGIPIAHIEGGDLSGAIDNKVRKAITSLADIHFSTNKESYSRLIQMGTDPDWAFNFGSLDVEYAKSVKTEYMGLPYVVMCHHAMEGESPELIEKSIREVFKGQVIVIKSNSYNGQPYGKEEFKPDVYVSLIAKAECLVGNSSSFIKEASAFGTPVVLIGDRQKNRLLPKNVLSVPFNEQRIKDGMGIQLALEKTPSDIYYKEGTSKNITRKIIEFLK